MDNLCHTLAGLALAEAGFKRKTALGTATMIIGANLPDVDIAAYFWGPVTALGFRRGLTHGLPALALWPFVLAGLMLAWDSKVRRRGRPGVEAASFKGLLLVGAVAVWSHPLLDFLNTYGMRWLMPLSGRWYYGDTLFIVDPWVWLVLAVGSGWARWRGGRVRPNRERPARLALGLVSVYALLMGFSNVIARRVVFEGTRTAGLLPARVMVAPVPLNPMKRDVVFELDGGYARGSLTFAPWPEFRWGSDLLALRDTTPAARTAAGTPDGQAYLSWARFPFYAADGEYGCELGAVCIRDARYFPQSWAEVVIPLRRRLSYEPPFRSAGTP